MHDQRRLFVTWYLRRRLADGFAGYLTGKAAGERRYTVERAHLFGRWPVGWSVWKARNVQ